MTQKVSHAPYPPLPLTPLILTLPLARHVLVPEALRSGHPVSSGDYFLLGHSPDLSTSAPAAFLSGIGVLWSWCVCSTRHH